MNLALLPKPQILETVSSESYAFSPNQLPLHMSGIDRKDEKRLLKALERFGWNSNLTSSTNLASLELICDAHLPKPATCRDDVVSEIYTLRINANGIRLISSSAAGLFRGLQTLAQIKAQTDRLPHLNITDWPDVPFRGQHLTLGSGHYPPFSKLLEIVDTLAQYKSNTFVVEYDDRFSFERHPVLVHKNALTKNQVRELIEYAADRYMDVIPLLDSLGHAQSYLRHKEYLHLAELQDSKEELCASNPQTLVFIKELWSEILEVHEGCKYAHITGDEVFRLDAFCKNCEPYAKSGRLGELFTNYYSDLSRWILEQGRRPIMWSDMIARYPEATSNLPGELIVNDWNYRGMDTFQVNTSHVWGYGLVTRDTFPNVSEPLKSMTGPYIIHESTKPELTPFPYVRFFQDQGFEVIGASASSGHPFQIVGSYDNTVSNNKYFAKTVKEAGSLGLLCTHWSSDLGPFACLHGMVAGATYAWHYHDETRNDFLSALQKLLLKDSGTQLEQAADAYEFSQTCKNGFVTGREELDAPEVSRALLNYFNKNTTPSPGNNYSRHVGLSTEIAQLVTDCRNSHNRRFLERIGTGTDLPVDISASVNLSLKNAVHIPGSNLSHMGLGLKNVWGVPFELVDPGKHGGDSAIGTWGEYVPDRPRLVAMPVEGSFSRLFFLHTAAYSTVGGVMGQFRITNRTGNSYVYDVVNGDNIFDWHKGPFALPNAVIAWERLPFGESGVRKLAYLSWWDNPEPEVPIVKVEMLASDVPGYHILIGLTGRRFDGDDSAQTTQSESAESSDDPRERIEAIRKRLLEVFGAVMPPEDAQSALDSVNRRMLNQMYRID